MQIIVLGMHRSGTSVATRLVNMLGASVGPEEALMPVNEDNPKGFWERLDVQVLNDDILRALGGTWHRCGGGLRPWSTLEAEVRVELEARAKAIIAELDAAPNWVLKDPRMCLTLPLWRPLLDNPVFLTVFRSPLQTAQSLKRRNGFPLSMGLALWETYSAQGLTDSTGAPRYFTHFDTLLADPAGFLKDLLTWLETHGAKGLELPDAEAIAEFVDARLVHHRDEAEAMASRCTPHQAALYEALRAAMERGADAELPEFAVSDHAREILSEYEAVEHDRNRLKERQETLAKTREGLADTRQKMAEVEAELLLTRRSMHAAQDEIDRLMRDMDRERKAARTARNEERKARRAQRDALRLVDRLKDDAPKALALQRMVAEKNHHIFLLTERARSYHEHGRRMMTELERSFRDAERLRASLRWKLGSAAVVVAGTALRKPITATALDHILTVRDRYMAWRGGALTAGHEAPSAASVPMDTETRLHTASFAIQLKERTKRANGLRTQVKRRATEVRQLAQWLGQVLSDFTALEQSQRWRVGDTTLSTAETLMLRRRTATVFDHVRVVREMFQRWRSEAPQGLPALPAAIPPGRTLSVDLGVGQQYVDPSLWGGEALPQYRDDATVASESGRARPRLRMAPFTGSGTHTVQHPAKRPPHHPTVAAIIPNLNGGPLLEALFASAVEHNRYAELSFLVVDHGSSDNSLALCRSYGDRLAVRALSLGENVSFSRSCNAGAKETDADYLLFLNNDITFTADCLETLVRALDAPGVGAVGPLLRYPKDHPEFPGQIQHAGVTWTYDPDAGSFRPRNLDARFGAENPEARPPFSAVTGAALLCRRDEFLDLGGFHEEYDYGLEDVDLCLSLLARNDQIAVLVPDAVMDHHEGASLTRQDPVLAARRRGRNLNVLRERFGPALEAALLADRAQGDETWSREPLCVAFAVSETGESATAGDLFTARELAEACEAACGWVTRLVPREQWYDDAILAGADVVVALVDGFDPARATQSAASRPGLACVAWLRNQFERWTEHEHFADFDCFLCASESAAALVREDLGADRAETVLVFPIATNPDRFAPGGQATVADESLRSAYCFTGSRWNVARDIESCLGAEPKHDGLAVFGRGWEESPLAPYARGFLAYDRMADAYRATSLVLDDANTTTLAHGSMNSRVFDALACGRLVLTNNELASAELFGGKLPVYADAASLDALLDTYLNDDAAREELAASLRQEVLEHHTYAHRAVALREALTALAARRAEALEADARLPLDLATRASFLAAGTSGMTASGPLSPLAPYLMEAMDDAGYDGGRDMHLLDDSERERLAQALAALPQDRVVNVVMPAWNRAATITEAVRSVQDQIYTNWRLDVVDDGSEDDTVDVVRALAQDDPRIRIHAIEHRGVSAARNFGLLQADGDYVAYLDSDNTWDPDYLLFMTHALEDTDAGCAYCSLRLENRDTGETSNLARRFDYANLLRNNYIDINIFVHRRSLAGRVGGFDTELKRWVDWDLIIRCVADMDPLMVPLALCSYTISSANKQITHQVSDAFKNKVLTKYLVDWSDRPRIPGHTTIVIPVYDQAELTRACIESIQKHTSGSYDVLVVDNGCKDHTPQVLAELEARYSNVGHVTNYENYGFALGCNIGVGAARGEYVILLNNDTTVTPGWIEPLLAPIRPGAREPQPATPQPVGIVGPKLLFPDDTLQCGGIVFSHKSKIPYHVYQHRQADDPVINKRRVFQAVTGACMAMRAEDFLTLRGFDPVFLNGGEDIDFCFRMARDVGKTSLYDPASVVYHYEGKTEGRGKNIMYNRELLVARWRDHIAADDFRYYADDGLQAVNYTKKGTEPHGETAAYYPELVPAEAGAEPVPASAEPGGEPIDVAFCAMWYERGITFHARQLARALEYAKPGDEGPRFRTHVFARWESEKFANTGPVLHPRVTNAGDDPSAEETVRWARERNIKLWIQMEVHPKDWKRIEALQHAGIRVVGYENLDILRTEYMDRYARFDALLSNALHTNALFAKEFPAVPRLCVPWGVPPEHPLLSTTTRFDNRLTFVHVAGWGGVNNRKNSSLLVRAFHKAATDNAVLRLFTQNPVNALGDDVADIVAASSNILVTQGTVPDIFEAYAGADMLLWPSKREGLGLPILEALACGVPCLVSDGWMMKQWLVPGEHGRICPAEPRQGMMHLPEMQVDEDALAGMIRDLAARPEKLEEFKTNVLRDREQWLWTWQPGVFREQIGRLAQDPAYRPADDLTYLPASALAFEERRVAAEQALKGEG